MISSPELIKLRWAYFYAHIADHCNEDMADAFHVISPCGESRCLATGRASAFSVSVPSGSGKC